MTLLNNFLRFKVSQLGIPCCTVERFCLLRFPTKTKFWVIISIIKMARHLSLLVSSVRFTLDIKTGKIHPKCFKFSMNECKDNIVYTRGDTWADAFFRQRNKRKKERKRKKRKRERMQQQRLLRSSNHRRQQPCNLYSKLTYYFFQSKKVKIESDKLIGSAFDVQTDGTIT